MLFILLVIVSLVTSPVTKEAQARIFSSRNYTYLEDHVLHRVKRQSKCGTDGSCILPLYPEDGEYKVSGVPTARPGQSCDSVVLRVICDIGYGIVAPDGQVSVQSDEILCIDGTWSPRIMPQCVRLCELIPDPSVRYTCRLPGSPSFQACGPSVPQGTTVEPTCVAPLYYSHKSLLYMHCYDGGWDYVATCEPECGRVTTDGVGLITNGKAAKRGELPWHVGVYSKTTSSYTQICGGSLVANNIVISAAHCFWHDVLKNVPASKFAVAAGKLYRTWKSENDNDSQESDVKEIRIPERFQGTGSNLQADMAVLILVTPFVFKAHVKPVCLSFALDFDNSQLQSDKIGKVAGWGLTSSNGPVSEELRVVEMPFIEYGRCYNAVPASFQQFITLDKFCAGYLNRTAVCQGDSGGGIAFATSEQHTQRYYLRGVVSSAPSDSTKQCNDASYATFTRVADYAYFIKEAMQIRSTSQLVFPAVTCSSDQVQCQDGSCSRNEEDCFWDDNTFKKIVDFALKAKDLKKLIESALKSYQPSDSS